MRWAFFSGWALALVPFGVALAQDPPSEAAPVEAAPSEPVHEAAPAEPAPVVEAPVEPAPVEAAPIEAEPAEPAPTAEPTPIEATSLVAAEPTSASEPVRAPVAIEAALGLQMLSRHFRYTDDVYGFLRPYTLPAAPAVSIDLRWFPGAHFTSGVGAAFGLDVRFDRSFGIESERAQGFRYPTVNRVVEVSALGRYRIRDRYELLGVFGWGNHTYELHNTNAAGPGTATQPDVPNVAYSYLRFGAEARMQPFRGARSRNLGFLGSIAYLAVLSAGGIQEDTWFPRSRAGGMTLGARIFYALPHRIELRAGLEFRRYFFAMHPHLNDPFVAGGALDQYTMAELAVAYRY